MILLLEARMTLWRAEQQSSSPSSSSGTGAGAPVAPFRFLRGRSPHRLFNLADEPLRAGHHPLVFYAAMAGISQIAYLALYLAGFRYYAGSGTVSFSSSSSPLLITTRVSGCLHVFSLASPAFSLPKNSGPSRSGSCAPRQSRSRRRSTRQRPLGWATLDSPRGSGTGTSPRRSKRRRMTPSRCVKIGPRACFVKETGSHGLTPFRRARQLIICHGISGTFAITPFLLYLSRLSGKFALSSKSNPPLLC